MVPRILASIILLLSILFLPFYISVILAVVGIVYFSFFLEAVVLFFISDLLYGAKESNLFYITLISLFISILLIILLEFLKRKLRFNF